MSESNVMKFIGHFHDCGKDLDTVFLNGCCFWFAEILCARFPSAEMMYDPIRNHFAAKIGGKVFDISGDITEKSGDMIPWSEFDDESERRRIVRDCVVFA